MKPFPAERTFMDDVAPERDDRYLERRPALDGGTIPFRRR